ncbi:hypothetical protein BH23GEM7_BH23GEM7_12090 [soil metagenome]
MRRTRSWPRRCQWGLRLVTVLLMLAGCRDFLAEPAPGRATLALAFDEALPMQTTGTACPLPQLSGIARVYDRVDSVRVGLAAAGGDAFNAIAAFPRDDTETAWLSVFVDDLQGSKETRQLTVELLVRVDAERRRAVLFRDSARVELQRGGITRVEVAPRAIADAVLLSAPLAPIGALGDTVQLCGVVLFATGDTIPGLVPVWRTLDPGIAEISPDGRLIARAEGEARIVGEYQQSIDTVWVMVRAVASSLTVTPTVDTLQVGGLRALQGELRDSRGNLLAGRVLRWSSSDPAVASVEPATGLATLVTAQAGGSATITAWYEAAATGQQVSATAQITVRSPHPLSVTKRGSGSGTVTSSPAGINCGSTCTASYAYGTSVTLRAVAATGSSFSGWSGGGGTVNNDGSYTVSLTEARSVTATFTNPFHPDPENPTAVLSGGTARAQ